MSEIFLLAFGEGGKKTEERLGQLCSWSDSCKDWLTIYGSLYYFVEFCVCLKVSIVKQVWNYSKFTLVLSIKLDWIKKEKVLNQTCMGYFKSNQVFDNIRNDFPYIKAIYFTTGFFAKLQQIDLRLCSIIFRL